MTRQRVTWIRPLHDVALALLAIALGFGCGSSAADVDGGASMDAGEGDGGVPDEIDGGETGGADDAGEPDAERPCVSERVHGDAPPLARLDDCGRLSYGLYAAEGQTNAVHVLPDFSFAGYMRGGVALPVAAVERTVEPADGDDRGRIQAAIDAVSALPVGPDGLRGAVLLRRGTYQVGDTLTIGERGVVLRGEGQGTGGTVLVATRREQHTLLRVQGDGSGFGEVPETRARITTPHVPVGAQRFEVESADAFEVGDTVVVERTPNQAWIEALGMDAWGWTPSAYTVGHERMITAIAGRTITVDIPIVDALEEAYGGGAVYLADLSGRVSQVGVEDLRIESEYASDTDEAHGWVAVSLRRATDSWVRRVTAVHFGYAAVSVAAESSFNTIEDCAMLAPISQVTGGRRYSFNVGDGIGNLFQRCYSDRSRHDFVTGAQTTGPNVWLDCLSTRSTSDDGPHHRWSTGALFDNTFGHRLHVENRQSSGTGHGWSGAQVLFWNATAVGIRCDAPLGAMNWAVGCVGSMNEGGWAPEEPFGWWESHGAPVEPRSIYLAQLRDRLGPEAVEAVTLPAQREGRIWEWLAGWAGDGRLEDATPATWMGDPTCATGVSSGTICCAASCGTCGGSGCGGRPGGAESCCSSNIESSGRSCSTDLPPCVL